MLVGGGLELWHGNRRSADGDPDMFPEIIHMGQETRRDPALLARRHRLREPAWRQPDRPRERETLAIDVRVQCDIGRRAQRTRYLSCSRLAAVAASVGSANSRCEALPAVGVSAAGAGTS